MLDYLRDICRICKLLIYLVSSQWSVAVWRWNSEPLHLKYIYPSNYVKLFRLLRNVTNELQRPVAYIEHFMESTPVQYLRNRCWRIRNPTSKLCDRVRFLIKNINDFEYAYGRLFQYTHHWFFLLFTYAGRFPRLVKTIHSTYDAQGLTQSWT